MNHRDTELQRHPRASRCARWHRARAHPSIPFYFIFWRIGAFSLCTGKKRIDYFFAMAESGWYRRPAAPPPPPPPCRGRPSDADGDDGTQELASLLLRRRKKKKKVKKLNQRQADRGQSRIPASGSGTATLQRRENGRPESTTKLTHRVPGHRSNSSASAAASCAATTSSSSASSVSSFKPEEMQRNHTQHQQQPSSSRSQSQTASTLTASTSTASTSTASTSAPASKPRALRSHQYHRHNSFSVSQSTTAQRPRPQSTASQGNAAQRNPSLRNGVPIIRAGGGAGQTNLLARRSTDKRGLQHLLNKTRLLAAAAAAAATSNTSTETRQNRLSEEAKRVRLAELNAAKRKKREEAAAQVAALDPRKAKAHERRTQRVSLLKQKLKGGNDVVASSATQSKKVHVCHIALLACDACMSLSCFQEAFHYLFVMLACPYHGFARLHLKSLEVSNNFVRLNLKRKWKGKVRRTRKGLEARRPVENAHRRSEFNEPRVVQHKWGEKEEDDENNGKISGFRGMPTARTTKGGISRSRGHATSKGGDGVPSSGVDTLHTCLGILNNDEESKVPESKKKNAQGRRVAGYVQTTEHACEYSVFFVFLPATTSCCDLAWNSVHLVVTKIFHFAAATNFPANCFASRSVTPVRCHTVACIRSCRWCSMRCQAWADD